MRKFRSPILAVSLLVGIAAASGASAEILQSRSPDDFLSRLPPAADLIVINFWATWCIPCVAELEDFSRLDREMSERVVFVGISLDDAVPDEPDAILARVTKMLNTKKIDYLNVLYLGNPAELTARWNIAEGIPQTIITDSNGEVLHTVNGRIEAESFFEELTRLLEQTRERGKPR